MTDLKPCPFCGGKAELRPNDRGIRTPDIYGWHVECVNDECIIGLMDDRQWYEDTKAEAIAAWNARAERTCRDASLDKSTQFYCSVCECTVDMPLLWGDLKYCPGCGARVERGDA